jgi:hypothetical protein
MRKHKNEKRGKNNEFTKSISQREEKKEKDICKRFFKDVVELFPCIDYIIFTWIDENHLKKR